MLAGAQLGALSDNEARGAVLSERATLPVRAHGAVQPHPAERKKRVGERRQKADHGIGGGHKPISAMSACRA